MTIKLSETEFLAVIYALSFAFLISVPYLIEYPVGDEFAYVKQARLLLEGKTQPNWLQSTSYLTLLAGMPIIQNSFSFVSLRMMMILISAISAPLMYMILRELNAKRSIAALSAFVLITSPFVAVHLRQFITEPISLPLYLLAILLIVKGMKTGKGVFFLSATVVSILGFLNKQIDIIPAMAAFLFLSIHGIRLLPIKSLQKIFLESLGLGKHLFLKNFNKNLLLIGISVVFALAFFLYNVITTGYILAPTTIPSTVTPDAPYAPQFGIKPTHNAFRVIQDIIFIGFMFLPFGLYIKNAGQKIIVLASVAIALLAALSGKPFIFHSNPILVFVTSALFAYSGLNLALYIFRNRRESAVMNFSFIALVGCVIFTILKINIFLLKYYMIFLPFILIFLANSIKSRIPYVVTILILGGFGFFLTVNDINHHEKVWSEVNNLLSSGVSPNDIDGHPTVVSWFNDLTDNINAHYKIVIKPDSVFYNFVDVDSIEIRKT